MSAQTRCISVVKPPGGKTALKVERKEVVGPEPLVSLLNDLPPEQNWVSGIVWGNDNRATGEPFESASVIAVDADYVIMTALAAREENKKRAKAWKEETKVAAGPVPKPERVERHVHLPADMATKLVEAFAASVVHGTAAHLSPRGLRVFFLLTEPITDGPTYVKAARGAAAMVKASLVTLGLYGIPGLEQDDSTYDLNQWYWAPHARIVKDDGSIEQRHNKVHLVGGEYELSTLLAAAEKAAAEKLADFSEGKLPDTTPEKVWNAWKDVGGKATPDDHARESWEEFVTRYRANHPVTYPPHSAPCPICQGPKAFGVASRGPDFWRCYDTNHAAYEGYGVQTDSGSFTGDILDIHAADADMTPKDFAKQQGWRPKFTVVGNTGAASAPPGGGGDGASQNAPGESEPFGFAETTAPFSDADPDPTLWEATDLGNGGRYKNAAKGVLLWVPKWKQFHVWDGKRWAEDEMNYHSQLAAKVARDILQEMSTASEARAKNLLKHAFQSQKQARVEAMVKLGSLAYPDLKIGPTQFDMDPFLFNVENGTLDLHTGKLGPHRQADRITKLAPVTFDPDAKCPLWEKFTSEVLPDAETVWCVQKFLGYALSGDTSQHKLLFFYGPQGRNGKGTLVETLLEVLGDFAGTAAEELLLAKKWSNHPTELAALFGKRLVAASETEDGRSWSETRVKFLTGGDTVAARKMREDFWYFTPTHKFIVLSNFKPHAEAASPAFWSRMLVVPFNVSFREADDKAPAHAAWPLMDTALKGKLLAERSGILNWLLAGCMAWQKEGLAPSAAMRKAGNAYKEDEEDLLDSFIREKVVGPDGMFPKDGVPLQEFTDKFGSYCELNEEEDAKLNARKLARVMRSRGFKVQYPPMTGNNLPMRIYPRGGKE